MTQANLSPLQRYQADLTEKNFVADPAQAQVVDAFEELFHQLNSVSEQPDKASKIGRLFRKNATSQQSLGGLYLWGGVGRGKTWLMDCFFDALPQKNKRRTHFHRFMKEVHERQKDYPKAADPLRRLAKDIAKETQILCFDEFFVSDVADAMILGRLIQALFDEGLCLVATSNIPPQRLYENGLQRASFLPAIDAIQAHTQVMHVDGPTDFRLRVLQQAELFHHPLDEAANENLQRYFQEIAPHNVQSDCCIDVLGRPIDAIREADGVLWAEFSALCFGPRSAADYVELAQCYHSVLLSGLQPLTWEHENEARRFINLVDEFYDRGVKLIISSACELTDIYQGEKLCFEFERTQSRLLEMQSQEYLERPHLP